MPQRAQRAAFELEMRSRRRAGFRWPFLFRECDVVRKNVPSRSAADGFGSFSS
jgi:hypothetical protein